MASELESASERNTPTRGRWRLALLVLSAAALIGALIVGLEPTLMFLRYHIAHPAKTALTPREAKAASMYAIRDALNARLRDDSASMVDEQLLSDIDLTAGDEQDRILVWYDPTRRRVVLRSVSQGLTGELEPVNVDSHVELRWSVDPAWEALRWE